MNKIKSVATIGYQIPGHSDQMIDFSSRKSLMDYDIIIFAPILPYYQTSDIDYGQYQGKICYGNTGSFKLKEDFAHWKNELSNALHAGKTVFFLLVGKDEFFVDTGQRIYSGTGRSRSTSVTVAPGNSYQLLPLDIGSIHSGNGKSLVFTGVRAFKRFYDKFKNYLEYQIYLENIPKSEVIFTGKDKSKILGFALKVGSGIFIALPFIVYNEEKFIEKRKDKKGKEKSYWTKEAMKFGSELLNTVLEIDAAYQSQFDKTPPPAWAIEERYLLKKEKELLEKIKTNEDTIKRLADTNTQLLSDSEEESLLKNLLYEQGKFLERAVSKALAILGFSAENYNDGVLEMDQIITGPEGIRCIGECEGKDSKDINIDKLRQLVETMNADFYRDGVDEKATGILFGNPQRLIDPQKRTLDFTDKCKRSAEREKIALVRTIDLYRVASYLTENENELFKKSCRDAIYNGLGKIIEFPQNPDTNKSR